jgi:hypothetical protein
MCALALSFRSFILTAALFVFLLTVWACDVRMLQSRGNAEQRPPVEDIVLDADQLQRLRVQWHESHPWDWKWGHKRCPLLAITGRLLLLDKDAQTLRPVDKPLRVAVALRQRPDEQPDWSYSLVIRPSPDLPNLLRFATLGEPYRMLTTDVEPLEPLAPGVFVVHFRRSELYTEPGKTRAFQIGLCVGDQKDQFASKFLPQSVRMVDIPGPQPLSPTLQYINACPTPLGRSHDPVPVIRAVNHLHLLGKEKTIASLREFLRLAYGPDFERSRNDVANIDTSNQWCLETLLPPLFPNLDYSKRGESILVWQGIPFHTYVYGGYSGSVGRMDPCLDEAEREGKLLEQPLRPADNPLEAADSLYAKIGPERPPSNGFNGFLQLHLRAQAWRAVRHLNLQDWKPPTFYDRDIDVSWQRLKDEVVKRKIRWDKQKQEYVAGAKPE